MDNTGPTPSAEKVAADLYGAVAQAYQLLEEAHASYTEALSIVTDTELSSDDVFAVQQRGREYAEAVVRYSEIAMAWFGLRETNREAALKLIRKAVAGE